MQFSHHLLLIALLVSGSLKAAPLSIEAETNPLGQVVKDLNCSNGAYVIAPQRPYEPIFRASVPDNLPENVWIFVRRMGAPVQLKAITQDQQSDLTWDWTTPGEFSWSKMGPFPRASLGETLLVIRGDAGPSCAIDSVVITDEINPDLEAFLPPLPAVPLSVEWTNLGRIITRDHFGLNCFSGLDPKISANPQYISNLLYMNPGILRIHNGGMMESAQKYPSAWVDHENQCWDKERVLAALLPLRTLPTRLIICINTWPAWMDQNNDGRLDISRHDDFAKFCADLVSIVNAPTVGEPVLWWEITNEKDDRYHKSFYEAKKPDLLNELTDIYLKTSVAMKLADPRVKTGGPATTNSYNVDFHKRFIAATSSMLDFYSMHLYLTGSREMPDTDVFARSTAPAWPISAVRVMLDEVSPNRKIELMMNEYNINWDWQQEDPRMKDWRSAVWDAAFCLSAIGAGVDSTAAWNECDGAYGKTNSDHQRRLAADGFHLINEILPGSMVPAQVPDPSGTGLRVLAVVKPDGAKALVILNIGTRCRTLTGVHGKVTTICRDGVSSKTAEGSVMLPSISLAIIKQK